MWSTLEVFVKLVVSIMATVQTGNEIKHPPMKNIFGRAHLTILQVSSQCMTSEFLAQYHWLGDDAEFDFGEKSVLVVVVQVQPTTMQMHQ